MRNNSWRALRVTAFYVLKRVLFVLFVSLALFGVPLPIGPPARPGAPRPQGTLALLLRRKRLKRARLRKYRRS